jgi:hypothetical protein
MLAPSSPEESFCLHGKVGENSVEPDMDKMITTIVRLSRATLPVSPSLFPLKKVLGQYRRR